MTYQHSHQPPIGDDAYLIDEEFDDFLDRYLADFRESLSDYRNA